MTHETAETTGPLTVLAEDERIFKESVREFASDFVASLEATKWFKRPVEILDSQVQTDKTAGDLVKFSIKGTLNDPEAPPPPPPAPTGRGAGRGAAAGRGAKS